jgi:hypothetical protein
MIITNNTPQKIGIPESTNLLDFILFHLASKAPLPYLWKEAAPKLFTFLFNRLNLIN